MFCLIAFALGGLPGAARPDATPESAESAQTATPEDAAPPQAADQAVPVSYTHLWPSAPCPVVVACAPQEHSSTMTSALVQVAGVSLTTAL